jgi:DNA-binding transcriptional ArsR family regulator
MSLQALSHVMYEVRGIDPTAKLILLAIADHIHSETGWAWPSTTRLADLAGVSKRSAIRHIDTLEQAGILEVDRRQGRASGYRIVTTPTKSGDTGVTTPEPTGDTHVTTPVTPTSPLTGDTHDTSTNQPVTPVTRTGDTGVTQTVKNQEEEDEEDPPGGLSAARIADRVDLISQVIPASWHDVAVLCDDPRLDVLDELTAAGWTPRHLRKACATLPTAHSNPTGLLVRHLRRYRGRQPDVLAHTRTTTATPQPATECAHGSPTGAWCHDCEQETHPW